MAERRTRVGRRAQAGDDPIRGTQVGCTLAPAIEDEQLMPDQHGFGDNGTESTRPRQSGQGDDEMNEYDSEVAHPGNGINTSKTTALRANLAIRHRLLVIFTAPEGHAGKTGSGSRAPGHWAELQRKGLVR